MRLFFTSIIFLALACSELPAQGIANSRGPKPSVSCLGGGESTKQRNTTPMAVASFDTNECGRLENMAEEYSRPGTAQQGYDTARAFLTLCYDYWGAQGAFGLTDADNDNRNNNPNRYVEYREWLKSVLYLRKDSLWYCTDVGSIVSTFKYFEEHGIYPNGAIAVTEYVLANQKCDSSWFPSIQNDIHTRDVIWQDTVKDSLTEARPDTTIPSIDSIGLSILRGPQYAGVKAGPPTYDPSVDEISGLHVTENPFDNSTEVAFTLNDYGLVTFELYDELGKLETSNGIGQVLYPGEHTFAIDGQKLASGVYYARLSFHNGGTKTVMVRKR